MSELGSRQLVVEVVDGDLQGREDFTRPGVEVGRLDPGTLDGGHSPSNGRRAASCEKMRRKVVTFRLRLDPPGALDGVQSFVNVATMESGSASNRPQLHVVGSDGGSPTVPPTDPPSTDAAAHQPAGDRPPATTRRRPGPPVTSPPVTRAAGRDPERLGPDLLGRVQRLVARHVEMELRRIDVR